MTEADALASAGEGIAARAKMREEQRLIVTERPVGLPFLTLAPEHLARWSGHCLTVLGDTSALAELESALPGEGDSIRAAAGLHTDLAIAKAQAGDQGGAASERTRARELAMQCGSTRYLGRLARA